MQDPSDTQTFNRYSYCGNNPVNNIDPSGHSFWKSFAVAFVGAIATVLTAGLAAPGGFAAVLAAFTGGAQLSAGVMALSGAVGGAVAGGMGAALNGAGALGILQGMAMGGALGGLGGFAAGGGFGAASGWVVGGMFAGGVANAAVNNSWDDFAGGLLGGITGTAVGIAGIKVKLSTLSDSQSTELKSNTKIIKEVNEQKGNPDAVAKGAAQISKNAADTQTVITEELQIVKVGPEAEARSTSEALTRFSLKTGSKCMGGGCESYDYARIAASSLYKLNRNVSTVVIKAAVALDVVPASYIRGPGNVIQNNYLGIIGTHKYYQQRVRYEYGPPQ